MKVRKPEYTIPAKAERSGTIYDAIKAFHDSSAVCAEVSQDDYVSPTACYATWYRATKKAALPGVYILREKGHVYLVKGEMV